MSVVLGNSLGLRGRRRLRLIAVSVHLHLLRKFADVVKAAPYLGVVLVNEAAGLFRLFSPRIADDDSAAVWDAEPFIIMGVYEADALPGFLDVTVKPVLDIAVAVKVIVAFVGLQRSRKACLSISTRKPYSVQ